MRPTDDRADLCRHVARISDPNILGSCNEAIDEILGYRLIDQDAGTGQTLLPVVRIYADQRRIERTLKVALGGDDIG